MTRNEKLVVAKVVLWVIALIAALGRCFVMTYYMGWHDGYSTAKSTYERFIR